MFCVIPYKNTRIKDEKIMKTKNLTKFFMFFFLNKEESKKVENKKHEKNVVTKVVKVVSALKKIFPHNFRYEIGEVNEGGNKTRFNWNIEAIKALKEVESDKRLATESEQKVMSKYAGWGGIPQAFDKNAKGWEKECTKLHEMLTDEEYANARASVNNAFYTNPEIARAVNETLTRFGLKKRKHTGAIHGNRYLFRHNDRERTKRPKTLRSRDRSNLRKNCKTALPDFENPYLWI